jgi:hypothetical protein
MTKCNRLSLLRQLREAVTWPHSKSLPPPPPPKPPPLTYSRAWKRAPVVCLVITCMQWPCASPPREDRGWHSERNPDLLPAPTRPRSASLRRIHTCATESCDHQLQPWAAGGVSGASGPAQCVGREHICGFVRGPAVRNLQHRSDLQCTSCRLLWSGQRGERG